MRNLNEVIDAIVEVAPDLECYFSSVKSSVDTAAPELMWMHWNRAAEILNDHCIKHPKRYEIAKIFSGQNDD